jgi:hypothetical protein
VIDVWKDAEGVRIALEEIFEEDYVRSRVNREQTGASEETRERLASQVPPRTLSPGYYVFASHLLCLEEEKEVGVGFSSGELTCHEVRGLVALSRARLAFKSRHPPCGTCGAHQQNRFGTECVSCGIKFQRKK